MLVSGVLMTLSAATVLKLTKEEEFKGHRSGLYMVSNKDESAPNGVVVMYTKIDEKIGAYGLFHYQQRRDAALSARNQIEEAIKSNIENDQAKVPWKKFLAQTMKEVGNAVSQGSSKDESFIKALVVVVDRSTATQAKYFQANSFMSFLANSFMSFPSQATTVQVEEFERRNRIFLVMGTDFEWEQGVNKVVDGILEESGGTVKAAKRICESYPSIKGENDRGAIIIELHYYIVFDSTQ